MRTCIHALFAILSPALCADWKLVWSDEFNGSKLDYSKWGIEENAFGGGNHEQQIYTDRSKNVRVENGSLILEAHKDNAQISGTQRPYSSGRIRKGPAPRNLEIPPYEFLNETSIKIG